VTPYLVFAILAAAGTTAVAVGMHHPAWECPGCGRVNDDRTDLCSRCGDVRP